MDIDQIIRDLYAAFEKCERPEHFTNHDHCPECKEHDQTMLSATLAALDSTHLGIAGWSAWSFLTQEGFAHYMPRIVELAILGKGNKHGELFLNDIIFQLSPKPEYDRFKGYTKEQRRAVLEALIYASDVFEKELNENGNMESMAMAQAYWSSEIT